MIHHDIAEESVHVALSNNHSLTLLDKMWLQKSYLCMKY
jgi:hypothetical protein